MKDLSVESFFMPMVMPQTKFQAVTPKDVREYAFLAKADVFRQGLDSDCHNFLLLALVVTIFHIF